VLEDYEPAIAYLDRRLPVDPASYPLLIRSLLEANAHVAPLVRAELERVGEDAARLPHRLQSTPESGRLAQALTVKQHFAAALRRAETGNGKLSLQLPPGRLHELLRKQSYALTSWVRGSGQLNYRRFFDIADVAGLRTEDPSVFAAVHARSLPGLFDGTITGVRIDHIDGLREPTRYLQQLRDLVCERTDEIPYVVVEKILVERRSCRRWATAGTTGYEFAASVNGLFVEPAGFPKLAAHFAGLTGIHDFTTLVYDCKLDVMRCCFRPSWSLLRRCWLQLRNCHRKAPSAACAS
jgi:(1->4)-alpha-D-glucan 1-alpha-D-glucosylmutase